MNKDIMKSLGFSTEVEEVGKGICPFCHKPINIEDFADQLSLKEYRISGLCQKCQDDFFGGD